MVQMTSPINKKKTLNKVDQFVVCKMMAFTISLFFFTNIQSTMKLIDNNNQIPLHRHTNLFELNQTYNRKTKHIEEKRKKMKIKGSTLLFKNVKKNKSHGVRYTRQYGTVYKRHCKWKTV